MNLTDLRSVLDDQADAHAVTTEATPHVAVRGKIRRRARVRTTGAVVATVAAVAAGAVVVPNLVSSPNSAVLPAGPASTPLSSPGRTPTLNDTTVFGQFPMSVDGSRLLRSYVVKRGESKGAFDVGVPLAGAGFSVQCVIPDGSGHPAASVGVRVSENGKPAVTVYCDNAVDAGIVRPAGMSGHGDNRISLELQVAGKKVSIPQARIAVGVYGP